MAENTAEKDALKASKDAEKAAKKAKQDRIKQSKPKKEGSGLSRAGKAVKKFWKDFIGTVKKIVWPSGSQVLKNSLVVLVTILVIGLVVFGIDEGLTFVIGQGSKLAVKADEESVTEEIPSDILSDIPTVTDAAQTTENAETTEAGETTEAESTETAVEGETEVTTAAEETTVAEETETTADNG